MILRCNVILNYPGWAHCHHRVLIRGRQEESEKVATEAEIRVGRDLKVLPADFEDGEQGC